MALLNVLLQQTAGHTDYAWAAWDRLSRRSMASLLGRHTQNGISQKKYSRPIPERSAKLFSVHYSIHWRIAFARSRDSSSSSGVSTGCSFAPHQAADRGAVAEYRANNAITQARQNP